MVVRDEWKERVRDIATCEKHFLMLVILNKTDSVKLCVCFICALGTCWKLARTSRIK